MTYNTNISIDEIRTRFVNRLLFQLGFDDQNLARLLISYANKEAATIESEDERNRWLTQFIDQSLADKINVLSDKDKSTLVSAFKRERRDAYGRMFGFFAGALVLASIIGVVFSLAHFSDSADAITSFGRIVVPIVFVGFSIAMLVGSGVALKDLIFLSKKKKVYQAVGIFSETKAPSLQLADTSKQTNQQ